MSDTENELVNRPHARESNDDIRKRIEALRSAQVPQMSDEATEREGEETSTVVEERVSPEEEKTQVAEEQAPGASAEEEPFKESDEEGEALDEEEKSYKKRYGDIRTHVNNLTEELKELKAQNKELTELREATQQKVEEANHVADISENADDPEDIKRLKNQLKAERKKNTEEVRRRVLAEVRQAHPEFDALQESNAFHDWLGTRSQTSQDIIYKNSIDAKAVIDVLDSYTTHVIAAKAKKNTTRESAAKAVKGSRSAPEGRTPDGKKIWTQEEIANLSRTNQYAKYREEIKQAHKEKRIR